jgi:hypothetical protein
VKVSTRTVNGAGRSVRRTPAARSVPAMSAEHARPVTSTAPGLCPSNPCTNGSGHAPIATGTWMRSFQYR